MHIQKVFDKLREEKKKYNFVKDLVYLGFSISEGGLIMDLDKVKAIIVWPTPKSAIEIRSLHGLASFYGKFIIGFNSICGPLIEIMRGDMK